MRSTDDVVTVSYLPRMAQKGDEAWVLCGLRRTTQADGSSMWEWSGRVPIDSQDVEEARTAIRVLEEESEQKQLNLVLANFKTFFDYLTRVPQERERARADAVNPVDRLQTELATRLFNWLQSIRAYLDHTERRLKRRYGQESEEVAAFKEAASQEFDGVFAYRFFWKLRNYGHIDFPALGLTIDERAPIGLPREMSVTLVLRRDVLEKNFDEWGPVAADLATQPEEFTFIELMEEMMGCLDRIKAIVSLIEFEDLARCVGILDRLRDRLGDVAGYPHIARVETGDEGRPTSAQMIPIPPFTMPERDETEHEGQG
jgi:hypothetical protein